MYVENVFSTYFILNRRELYKYKRDCASINMFYIWIGTDKVMLCYKRLFGTLLLPLNVLFVADQPSSCEQQQQQSRNSCIKDVGNILGVVWESNCEGKHITWPNSIYNFSIQTYNFSSFSAKKKRRCTSIWWTEGFSPTWWFRFYSYLIAFCSWEYVCPQSWNCGIGK